MLPTADTIRDLLATHGHLTFKGLAAHHAHLGLSRHTLHSSVRTALDSLLASGHITCWSICKPYYLLTEEAPRIRSDLKAAVLREVMRAEALRPSDLKSLPLGGQVLPMDLLSALCEELARDGLIENVGRRAAHCAKVFRATPRAWQKHEDPITLETPLVAHTLRHLVTLAGRQLLRESAVNISRLTRQPLLEVKRALSYLLKLGLVQVTAQVGALELYGYVLAAAPVQRVERLAPSLPIWLPEAPLEAQQASAPPAPSAPLHTRALHARLKRPGRTGRTFRSVRVTPPEGRARALTVSRRSVSSPPSLSHPAASRRRSAEWPVGHLAPPAPANHRPSAPPGLTARAAPLGRAGPASPQFRGAAAGRAPLPGHFRRGLPDRGRSGAALSTPRCAPPGGLRGLLT